MNEPRTERTPLTERRRSTGTHVVDGNMREGETIEDVNYPPALQPEGVPPEPRDAGAPRSILHPTEAPPPWTYARTREEKIQAVEDFAARIATIEEGEYGDWMRRANMYWWHLIESLRDAPPPIRKILRDMHRLIQFNPDFKILETTQKVVQMCLAIRGLLGAREDLEIDDFDISVAGCTSAPAVPGYSERLAEPKPPKVEPLGGGSSQGFIGKG